MKHPEITIAEIKIFSEKKLIEEIIESIKHPTVELNLATYARMIDGVPYGCIATNLICRLFDISRKEFIEKNFDGTMAYLATTPEDIIFIDRFESYIDCLRRGNIIFANCSVEKMEDVNWFIKGSDMTEEIFDEKSYIDFKKLLELQ